MARREVVKASERHEREFRETYELREDVANDPYWQQAYEHTATYKLYPDEMAAIGPVLVHRPASPAGEKP